MLKVKWKIKVIQLSLQEMLEPPFPTFLPSSCPWDCLDIVNERELIPVQNQGKDAYIESGAVWPPKCDGLKNLTSVDRDLFEMISLCLFYLVWIQTFTPFQATAHSRVKHCASYPVLPHTSHSHVMDTYALFGAPGSVWL